MSERVAQWIEQIVGHQNFGLAVAVLMFAVPSLVIFFLYWIGKKIDQRAVECGLVTQTQLDKEKREKVAESLRNTPEHRAGV